MLLIKSFGFIRRKKKPASIETQTVNVLSVQLIDNTGAIWTFDSAVMVTENLPCAQLQIETSSGWEGASNIGATDEPNQIACDYASGDLIVGQNYRIIAIPENVTFDGASLNLPQSGITE